MMRLLALTPIFLTLALPTFGRTLVVGFSHGDPVADIAAQVAAVTSSDLFRIEAREAYPSDPSELEARKALEADGDLRPELVADRDDAAGFDVLVLVVPLWRETIPQAVATFLSSHDFSGRKIAPLVFSQDGTCGQTVERIEELCPNVDVTECLTLNGTEDWKGKVVSWLRQNGIL